MSDEQKKEMASIARAARMALDTAPQNAGFEHWQSIHEKLFSGMNDYKVGSTREYADWQKNRVLDNGMHYAVQYSPTDTPAEDADKVMRDYHKSGGIKNLDHKEASEKIAKLYSDLDYVHPMYEGNSRSLRAFTAQVARADGYDLQWADAVTEKDRDEVYLARDREVIDRRYPGLTFDRAMQTNDRAEYEAFVQARGSTRMKEARTMAEIVGAGLEKIDKAKAFETLPEKQAVAAHPELKPSYDALHKAGEAAAKLPEQAQKTYVERVASNIQNSLDNQKSEQMKNEAKAPPKANEANNDLER